MKRLMDRLLPKAKRVRVVAWLVGGVIIPILYRTLRVTMENEERVDRAASEHGGVIYVTWHGRALIPLASMIGRGCYALISRSNDGELLSAIFTRMGWNVIRGSSGKRGVEALHAGLKLLSNEGIRFAFTPDGPRGPAEVAKIGAAYFAQKSGKAIIPTGISATPRVLTRSWDSFLIPLPFSRAHFEYGEPILVHEGDDLNEVTARIQAAINAMQATAEERLGVPRHAPVASVSS